MTLVRPGINRTWLSFPPEPDDTVKEKYTTEDIENENWPVDLEGWWRVQKWKARLYKKEVVWKL